MKVRGPLLTVGAVVVLGVAILLVNMSKETEPEPQTRQAAQAVASAPAPSTARPAPPTPPPPQFPAKADYVGKIPTAGGTITLEITVNGDAAVAYACDGNSVESWLRGSAVNGALNLANKDTTSRLDGSLQADSVTGTLWIGQKKWDFKADPTQPPAGLYVYEDADVRASWIIDSSGNVTGVLRRPDGATEPAPQLSTEGSAFVEGRTVNATRVQGDSNV
jgi:hypothetical protein